MDFYADTSAVIYWIAGAALLGVFFVLLLSRYQYRLRNEVYQVAGLGSANGRRRFILYAITILLMFVLLLFSVFDLRFVKRDETLSQKNTDLLFVIDISNSMRVRDMKGSRLDAVKKAVRLIVDTTDNARFGIVLFSGAPLYYSPFTSDKKGFLEFLDAVDTNIIQPNGTDFMGAHYVVSQALAGESPRRRFIVFFSDGEAHSEMPEGAWLNHKQETIPTLVLGVGSSTGGELRVGKRRVRSKLEESNLTDLAGIVGGRYMALKTDGAWLISLSNKIGSLAAAPGESSRRNWYSQQHIYAALLLILFSLQIYLRRPLLPQGARA